MHSLRVSGGQPYLGPWAFWSYPNSTYATGITLPLRGIIVTAPHYCLNLEKSFFTPQIWAILHPRGVPHSHTTQAILHPRGHSS